MSFKTTSEVPKQIRAAIGRMRRAVQRHFMVDGLKNILLALLVLIIIDFALRVSSSKRSSDIRFCIDTSPTRPRHKYYY